MSYGNNDRETISGTPDYSAINSLSQAERDQCARSGTPLIDFAEHKKLKAAGAFKPGYERPLKFICLAD